MSEKTISRLTVTGILAVICIVVFFIFINVVYISGNELGVKETWASGVSDTPVRPGINWYFPGFANKVFKYDMSTQIFVMNDKPEHEEYGTGRLKDAYTVQSAEGQSMTISFNMRWRRDPDKIVALHKTVQHNIEERILRPILLRVIKDKSTICKAIDAYSGRGLVQLQNDIETELTSKTGELFSRGVIAESCVIEQIDLDSAYITEIKARQVAVQRELRAKQEQQAALAEAEKAKAESQADYNRKVVEAERDKQVGVLAAEKAGETQVIMAEADKKQTVLKAEGEKEAAQNKADAILAVGKAEAESKMLQLKAYSGEGADNFVKIEVAKAMAQGYQNIKGYLPQNMNVLFLTQSFSDAVDKFMSGHANDNTDKR